MVGSRTDFSMETARGPDTFAVGIADGLHSNVVIGLGIQTKKLEAVCGDIYRSGTTEIGNGGVFNLPIVIVAAGIPVKCCTMHANGGYGEVLRCVTNVRCVADHEHRVERGRAVIANIADFLHRCGGGVYQIKHFATTVVCGTEKFVGVLVESNSISPRYVPHKRGGGIGQTDAVEFFRVEVIAECLARAVDGNLFETFSIIADLRDRSRI